MTLITAKPITRTARLVLDVREWLGTVRAGRVDLDVPGLGLARAVVRPDAVPTVTATPTVPRDRNWPFAGPMELVPVRTPSGLLAFHGQVRSPGGPLRRLLIAGTRCDLRIESPGYRASVLMDVAIPAKQAPTLTREVYIYPTGELPDAENGPTVLTGLVTKPDGTTVDGGVRVESDPPTLRPVETDENGVWILELDPPGSPRLGVPGMITLVIRDRAGIVLHREQDFAFLHRRLNRFPRTTLRGRVQTPDGRPIRGAAVELEFFAGAPATRPDGSWFFALPLGVPGSGTRDVRVRVAPPGESAGPFGSTTIITFGQANEIPTITV